MATHNRSHGGSNGRPQGRAPHNHNNQPRDAEGINSIRIPETIVEAVARRDKGSNPQILLRAFGGGEAEREVCYQTVGKVLVVRKAPIDWSVHREKIDSAVGQGLRKRSAALALALEQEGRVKIDSVVLPTQPGATQRVLTLRQHVLEPGDHYEVVTIHKTPNAVWFRTETARPGYRDEYGTGPCSVAFPLIGGHLIDEDHGEYMLQRLSAFCGIPFQVSSLVEYRRYRRQKLSVFEANRERLNAERAEAIKALREADIRAADALLVHSQHCSGFSHPIGVVEPEVHDAELVKEVEEERETYVVSARLEGMVTEPDEEFVTRVVAGTAVNSMEELIEAREQAEAASQFEAAMAKAREERAAKAEGRQLEAAGVGLSAKAQRGAEMARQAATSFQKPVFAAPISSGRPAWMGAPATPPPAQPQAKPELVVGRPAWMDGPAPAVTRQAPAPQPVAVAKPKLSVGRPAWMDS